MCYVRVANIPRLPSLQAFDLAETAAPHAEFERLVSDACLITLRKGYH